MNKDELNIYVLESLKQYGERHQLCPSVSLGNFREWIHVVEQDLALANITDYTPQEILEVFLSVYMKHINPVNEKTEEISKLICEYCLKWSEMTIKEDGKPDKVVRPPYVMNGSKLKCSVTHNNKTYSAYSVTNSGIDFIEKKKVVLSVNVDTAKLTFTVGDEPVQMVFASSEYTQMTLSKIEGMSSESIWTFDAILKKPKKNEKKEVVVRYVVRGDLIKINDYINARYTDTTNNKNYSIWKSEVRSRLSDSAYGKGKHKGYKRPQRDWQAYSGEAIGKAHPDTIVNYLTEFYKNLSEKEMQDNLNNYCIGIDCSGFVTRALSYVMEHMKDSLNDDDNYLVQIKTIGPIVNVNNNQVDSTKLSKKEYRLNNAATYMKLYRDKLDAGNVYLNDDAEFNSLDLIGSKLLYLFNLPKGSDGILINKDLNPSNKPEITSLRPGDVVTMGLGDNFKDGFHIAIVCYVGIDLEGPYFITADSSPSTLAETVNSIKTKHNNPSAYSILQRPDSAKVPMDTAKPKTNQSGTGVRYILHRDFGFFNLRPFLAFRRPYALARFYRKKEDE